MEYVRSEEGTKKTLSKKIGDFFHRVFRMMKTFFSKESSININGLFKDIQSGIYKNKVKFKETNLADIASYRTREIIRQERFDNPILEQDGLDYMRYKFNSVINFIKKQRKLDNLDSLQVLVELSKDKTIKEAGGDGFSYVMNYMLNAIKSDSQKAKGNSSYKNYVKLLSVMTNTTEENVNKGNFNTDYVRVIEKDGKTKFVFTGKTNLVRIFQANLRYIGINYKNKKSATPRDVKDSLDIQKDIDDGVPVETAWDRGHMEIDQKDTLSQKLKQFFSDVPVMTSKRKGAKVIRNAFGSPMMHDFNSIYAFMIQNVSGTYTNEKLMKTLKAVESKQPYVSYIINKLEQNPSVLADMVVHIGTKSYNKFINATWDGTDFSVFYSNRKDLDNIVQVDLIANFHNQSNTLLKKEQVGGVTRRTGEKVDIEKAKVFLTMLQHAKGALRSTGLSEADIQTLAKHLKPTGIPLAAEEINRLINLGENKKDNAAGLLNALTQVAEELVEGRNPFLYLRSTEDIENPDAVGESNVVQNLASLMSPIYEENVVSAFKNVEKKTVYNFQLSNFLSKKMNEWSDPQALKDWYDEVKTDPTFSNSPLIKELLENPGDIEELSYAVLDGINDTKNRNKIKYSKMSPKNLESVSMAAFNWSTNYGYFRLPIPSDSTNTPMIRLKKHSEEEIVNNLLMVAKGELETIQRLKNLKKQDPNADIFGVESGSGTYADKANKFTTLTFLNGKIPTNKNITKELENQIKEEISKFLNGEFLTKQLDYYKEVGIVDSYNLKEGTVAYGEAVVSDDIAQKIPMTFMKDYLFNSFYANTQLTTLFSGNPAFYKGVTDYQKRNKQIISPRTYLDTSNTYKSTGVRQTYKGIVVKDVYEKSSSSVITAVESIIDDSDLSDNEKIALKALWEKPHNITDGQTLLHPRRTKEILIGLNRWNDIMEAAYQRVLKGTETMQDLALFPPMKPHVFSHRLVNGIVVPTQHKNSEIMLTKSMAYLKSSEGDLMFPDLIKLYNMMDKGILIETADTEGNPITEKQKIDVILFDSAVKVGRQQVTTWETLNNTDFNTTPLNILQGWKNSDWGLQQETPAHHIDEINNFGTQLRNLIIEGIDPTGNYQVRDAKTGKVKKTRKGSKTAEEYQKLVIADLTAGYKEVEKIFLRSDGSVNYEELLEILREEVLDMGLGTDYLEALDESIDANGQIIPNLPIIHPLHANRIEKILNSFFKNNVTKQKIGGGQFINTSSFGVFKHLKMNINKKTGTITMDVMLPAWSREFFEKGETDFEKLKYTNPELLELIGYRIPTEHKYSMYKLNVVGFTPAVSGGQLILPREITTTTGLDFDIDKFFVMVPAFKKDADGKLRKIEFTTDPEEAWAQYLEQRIDSKESAEIAMSITGIDNPRKARQIIKSMAAPQIFDAIIEDNPEFNLEIFGPTESMKQNFLDKILQSESTMTKEQFMKLDIYEQNTKEARDNAKIDIIGSILTNKHTAIDIVNGGNFDNLIEQSTRVRMLERGDSSALSLNSEELKREALLLDEKEDLNINYPSTQLELFNRNMAALDLIGIMAINNTHHAKAQFTDMRLLEKFRVEFANKSYTELNLRDKHITQNLATLLAAVVDNANDPVSSFLNLNTFTANLAALYTRLGINTESTFYFLSSPILKEFSKHYFNGTSKGWTTIQKIADGLDNVILSKFQELAPIKDIKEAKEWALEQSINAKNSLEFTPITVKELQDQHLEKDELKKLKTQVRVLKQFMTDYETASELSQGVLAARVDTKGVGPTQADNYVFLNQQRALLNITSPRIIGLESVFLSTKDSEQIMIPGFNKWGLMKPVGVMDKILPYNGRPNPKNPEELIYNLMGTIKNFMSDEIGFRDLNVTETELVQRDLINYYMSGFPFFKSWRAKEVLFKMPSKLNNLKIKEREKENSGKRSAYTYLINALSVVESSKAFPVTRVEYNKTGVSKEQEQKIRAAWSYMLSDNTELSEGYTYSDLAKDLIRYTFFQNGFNFGPNTFNHLVPIKFYSDEFQRQNDILAETAGGVKITMNEYLRSVEARIRAMEGLTFEELLAHPEFGTFIKQFYQNNSQKESFVGSVKPNPKTNVNWKRIPNPKNPKQVISDSIRIPGSTGWVWNVKENKFNPLVATKITIQSNGPLFTKKGVPTKQNHTNKSTGEFVKYIKHYNRTTKQTTLYQYEYDEVFDPEAGDRASRIAIYTPIANLGQNQIVKEYNIDAKDSDTELFSIVGELRTLMRPSQIAAKKSVKRVINKKTIISNAPSINTKEATEPFAPKESIVDVDSVPYAVDAQGKVFDKNQNIIKPGTKENDKIITVAQIKYKERVNKAAVVQITVNKADGPIGFIVDPDKKQIIGKNGSNMVGYWNSLPGGPALVAKTYQDAREIMSKKIEEALKAQPETTDTSTQPVTKIISGGQTGVDQLGLEIGKELGIETGGTAPIGFLTEAGEKDPSLAEKYGVKEITDEEQSTYAVGKKDDYTARTEMNIIDSDGTVYFATDEDSRGKKATQNFAEKHNKPFLLNPTSKELKQFLIDNNIKT